MTRFLGALMHTDPVFMMLESNTPAETAKSAFSDNAGDIFGAIMMLLVMLAVIVGAYFVTRWIASGAMRMQKGSKMRIVDRLALSRDKYILVVDIGGYYYALGVANNAVTLLCELPDGIYGEDAGPVSREGGDWKSLFERSMKAPPPKKEPRRHVNEDELTRMAERMRKRSQSMNQNRESVNEDDE